MKINLKNYVTVRISQCGCEKFLNLCLQKNISFKNIKNDGFGIVGMLLASDFKKIRSCVRKSGVHISVIHKTGMGIYIKRHRKRYGFFAGAFMALLCMLYLTSCIWVIDVRGNKQTEREKIISALKK